MKRYEMVKSHEEFNKIIKEGLKIKGKYIIVFYTKKDYVKPNFGIAVGKKLGNAVVRNKLKRQYRNIIDNNRFLFKNNHNYIIMIRKSCAGVEYKTLEQALIELIEK